MNKQAFKDFFAQKSNRWCLFALVVILVVPYSTMLIIQCFSGQRVILATAPVQFRILSLNQNEAVPSLNVSFIGRETEPGLMAIPSHCDNMSGIFKAISNQTVISSTFTLYQNYNRPLSGKKVNYEYDEETFRKLCQ